MNLVFDFGGVLLRWTPHLFLQRVLPHRAPDEVAAHRLSEDFFQGFSGDWAEFDRGTVEPDDLAQRIARRTGLDVSQAQAVIAAVPDELQPLPDSVDLLHRLRAEGHRLFFLSNMPAPYADHLEATHDFLGLFDAGVFSSRVGLIKPELAIFRCAEQKFGLPGQALWFIDDVAHNVDAARAAGWKATHFHSAVQLVSELTMHGLLPRSTHRGEAPP